MGSITPAGLVHFAVYSERQAIPRRQVFELTQVGEDSFQIGNEKMEKRQSRGSIVREMACDVMMTVQTAEQVAKWLLAQIEAAKATQE